jgi:hypothetical protein
MRGWVVNSWVLDAHSVIYDPQSERLWDITFPDLAEHGIRFLRHPSGQTDEDFFRVEAQRRQHYCL